jgi:DNA-binding LacI/PurR family transcriptional regulator
LISVCRGNDLAFHIHDVETAADLDRHLATLTSDPLPAALIVMSLSFDGRRVAGLAEAGVPVVAVDSALEGDLKVRIDDVEGGALAVRHLIELGHRRIGFVGDTPEPGLGLVATDNRFTGYRRALAAADLPYQPDLVQRVTPGEEAGAALLDRPDPPTAIFAVSDVLALTVMNAAATRGVSVPDELSVVGFDNVDAAPLVGLTTVDQHLVESGRLAGEFILERGLGSTRRASLSLELLERRTTAPPT